MKNNIIKGASILSAILMLSVVMTPVLAAEVQPFNRWGYAYDGAGALDTVQIYGWCDGVSYGTDVTGTGGDIGLFSIDVFGDSTDSPTIKTGGWNGETVQYTIGDLTTTGTFFTETDSWLVGGFNTAPADIHTVASTPALMKISKISISPVPFIGIVGAGTVTDFALDINNGGAIQITAGDILGTIAPVTYINPASWGGISNDDALTISEAATGFIVDRVEFGTINVEPQETTMNNAPNPANNFEITRTPAVDTDTNDCLADFTAVTPPSWPGGVPTATATGPVNAPAWTNSNAVTITYTTTGGPASVDLFYDNGGGLMPVGTDSPADGSYAWTLPADGIYGWAADAGEGSAAVEASSYQYDGTNPIAEAGADMTISVVTQKLDATATDALSGVASTLWTYPANVICSDDNILNPDFSASADGAYTVTLTVTDNANNIHQDTFLLTWSSGFPVTTWDLFNGRNYRTFTSTVTGGWMASALMEDIVAQINAMYGEDLTNNDITCTQYTGSFNTCFWFMDSFWLNDFAVAEGDGYIIEILNSKLDSQPVSYELPNFQIPAQVQIALFNGRNYVGFPVTTTATMASQLLEEVVAEVNAAYSEDLTNNDVTLTQYTGSFNTCFWFMDSFWLNDFALSAQDGYILEILNSKLDVQPVMFTP